MNNTSRIAWLGILLLGASTSASADDKQQFIFAESFNAPLDSGWTWLREEPRAWKVAEGSLQIRTLPGHVFMKHNDARNVLLRKAPKTSQPLAVEVFVESRPKTQFEEAGLLWYYDDDNYLILAKEHVGQEVRVRMIHEQEGKPSFLFEKKYEPESVWLRLVADGGNATGYFRQTDQEEWQKMNQTVLPGESSGKGDAKIGLNAAGGAKDADRWARFRAFRLLELAE